MTKNQTDYFKTFCNISKAFGMTLNRNELLELIVQSAIDTMNGKAACLFLAAPEEDVFVPAAQKGLSDKYLHASPMKIETAVKELMDGGGYLAFQDATTDPRLYNHEAKKAEGIASILVVPVMVAGKAIGVLTLYTSVQRNFSQDEIDFLTALAEQGGMAIQQARLFERLNQNSKLFYDLSATLNSTLDIRKIFHILSGDIGEAFGMKGVTIRLYNPKTKNMDLISSYGLSEEFLDKGPISSEKGIASEVMKGETIIIKNIKEDPRLQYRDEAMKEGIVSVLCAPIKTKNKVIGEIRLFSSVERDFPEDVVTLIKALANQGGIAIENARLMERIRMNTELFHDLAVSINSTLDIQKILHIMSADIAEAIGVKATSIRLFDEDKKELRLVTSYGLSEEYLNKGPITTEEKAIFEALRNRPAIVNDVSTDDGVQYRKEKLKEGIASILRVPINARDDVIGVLSLYSDTPYAFSESEVILAMAMAHQGGLAIQNASMYLMLQEDKKDLEQDIWSHRLWF